MLRFLERHKSDQFRRRQRFYRLLGPSLLLLATAAWDILFLLRWDPYYEVANPVAPVWRAGWFLFLNIFIARLLLHFWFEVKWIFLWRTLRQLPLFLAQAALFAIPFTAPFLALRGYSVHAATSFQRRFPASRYSRIVDNSLPSQRFEDTRYLYCLYAQPAPDVRGEEIHLLRCAKGADRKIQQARALVLAEMNEALQKAPEAERENIIRRFHEREAEAVRPWMQDLLLRTFPNDKVSRLEFRICQGWIGVICTTASEPNAIYCTVTRDRGESWSEWSFAEHGATSAGLRAVLSQGQRPAARHIHVPADAAFIGSEEGVSLGNLRPAQIVEDADYVHLVYFRKDELIYARFSKFVAGAMGSPWMCPLAEIEESLGMLEGEARQMLSPTGADAIRGTGSGAGHDSSLRRAQEELFSLRSRSAKLREALSKMEEEFGKDRTKLEIVEEKLFEIESSIRRMEEERAPGKAEPPHRASVPSSPLPGAKGEIPSFIMRAMNQGREDLAHAREEMWIIRDGLAGLEEKLEEARNALEQNRILQNKFYKGIEKLIPEKVDLSSKPLSSQEIQKIVKPLIGHMGEWQKLEEKRREIIMGVRGPTAAELRRIEERLNNVEKRLILAEGEFRRVLENLAKVRAQLKQPFLKLPVEDALPNMGCSIYFGRPPERVRGASPHASGGTPEGGSSSLWVKYFRAAPQGEIEGKGMADVQRFSPSTSRGARGVACFLVSHDAGHSWRSASSAGLSWLEGRTFLLGTDSRGTDLFDRLVKGSGFYFDPLVLGGGLLGAFLLSTVLAFGSAVCDTRVWWQYLFVRRLSRVLTSSIASVPAIILLICVFVVLAARGASSSETGRSSYEWAIVLAIIFTQIPNVYTYIYEAISEYKSSEMLAHDLNIGLSWFTVLFVKIIRERCLRIFLIQAFYIVGYVILFETTLAYLGFTPPEAIESWGKLLVEEGKLPMARWLQSGESGANGWVFAGPLALALLTIYVSNRIGRLLAGSLIPQGRRPEPG